MRILLDCLAGDVDVCDALLLGITQGDLFLVLEVIARCVDEEDVFTLGVSPTLLAATVDDQNGHRDAGRAEHAGREADDGIDEVLFEQLLADTAFGGATEEDAVRHNDRRLTGTRLQGLDDVGDERVVGDGLRRDAAMEAIEAVALRLFEAPLIQGERRVGHDAVELHQAAVLDQLGGGEGVAPLDDG